MSRKDKRTAAKGRIAASRAGLLPNARLAGPMPWVIAIMIALTVVAAAAGLSLKNVAANARSDISGGLTVQVVEAERTPELQNYMEQIGGVGNYVNQTFGLFKAAEAMRPKKLLSPKLRE